MADFPAADVEYPQVRRITRVVVGVGALVIGGGIFVLLVMVKPQVSASNDNRPKPRVRIFEAKQVPVRRQWEGYAVIRAIDVADVPSRVTTTVQHVPSDVREGKSVKRGEQLMELDSADFVEQVKINEQRVAEIEALLIQLDAEQQRIETQLDLDRAEVKLAASEFERIARFVKQGAGNQQGLDRAERSLIAARRVEAATLEAQQRLAPRRLALSTQLKSQRAFLTLAVLNVERCVIQSPLEGVLVAVDVDEGEQVQPGMRVARVVNLDRVEAPLRLPASARQSVVIGDRVVIRTTNEHGLTCETRVMRINPQDDPDTRTVTVYVEVDQHHLAAGFGTASGTGLLLPGMFVHGRVTTELATPRWVVPRRSVRGGRLQRVRAGKLVSLAVTVDFVIEQELPTFGLSDRQWAVLSDEGLSLELGDQIVLDSARALLDGQAVEVELLGGVEEGGAMGEPTFTERGLRGENDESRGGKLPGKLPGVLP